MKTDSFIDDMISVGLDIGDSLSRLIAAPCTVLHAVSHKADTETFIPRDDMISNEKNEAEGSPEEEKICLEWMLDTRALIVLLPEHKFVAWTEQVNQLISAKSAGNKELESVLGRLENVAIIIAMFGHF